MGEDERLYRTEDLPKYNQGIAQLWRMEAVEDAAIQSYDLLGTSSGRERFTSASEMWLVLISPHLRKEDRDIAQQYINRLRIMTNQMNASDVYESMDNNNLDFYRFYAQGITKMLVLLKDKRGLGVPRKDKLDWKSDLASALDVADEAVTIESVKELPSGEQNE